VLWIAFKLLMGIVSQRPALIKVSFFFVKESVGVAR
jgi:hypothetical protein